MISFFDGPVIGRHDLNLRQTPVFLRVVVDTDGTVDALDMPEDVPKATEKVYAYKVVDGTRITAFMCYKEGHGGKRKCGCHLVKSAGYIFIQEQPTEEILRDNTLWVDWVSEKDLVEEV